jgi:hypothetical protein
MIDLEKLRAVALAATPGPWRKRWNADAAHIAALSPVTALALLDELEQLRKYERCVVCDAPLVGGDCPEHGGAGVSARKMIRDLDVENEQLRDELAAMTAARDEACRFTEGCIYDPLSEADLRKLAELRAVGRAKGTP